MKSQENYLATVFKDLPMTGFRRQKNLKEYLIRAKIPNPLAERPERNMKGMTKFGMQCSACHYIKEGRSIKFNQST